MTDIHQLTTDADRDGIQKIVVGAVVHSGGRVLILRRSADDFMPGIEELPSGGVEPGEDLFAALQRELAEEIGWTGRVTVDGGFVVHFDYVSGSGRRTRQFTFGLPYDGHPVTLSGEHTAFRWVNPGDVAGTDLTEESARVVRDWAATRMASS